MQCDNVVVLDKKLIRARFLSWCNELTHMSFHSSYNALIIEANTLKVKLIITRFPSACYVFDNNVTVLDRNYLTETNTH